MSINTNIQNYNIKKTALIEQMKIFINVQTTTTTKENYKTILKKFVKYLDQNNINEITLNQTNITSLIRQYQAYLINNCSLASTSINNYILRIQAFFNFLGVKTTIKKLDNTTKTKEYKYLTLQEINLLIETIPEQTNKKELQLRNKAIILLLFGSGLRVNELINLETTDYILKDNIYYVSIIGKGKAKDNKELIPIAPETSKAINNYLEIRKHKSNYLFCNIQSKKMTRQGINKTLKEISKITDKKYNLNITPRCSSHALRHGLARHLLINKQMPINQVKDILRHKKLDTTIKYLTNSENEINEIRINIFN